MNRLRTAIKTLEKRKAVLIFLILLLTAPLSGVAEAGVISGTLDIAGDVIALPFQAVGGLFRVLF